MNRLKHDAEAAGHSETFTREKNEEFYSRILEPGVKDALILGNMALVSLKVDLWIRNNSELVFIRDDLISAGILGLVEAVDYLSRAIVENPTGCIYHCIDAALARLVAEESTIPVSYDVQWEAVKNESPIPVPIPLNEQATTNVFSRLESPDPIAEIELKDELFALCQNDHERTIIQMRSEGYNDLEISEAIGTTQRTVTKWRDSLRQRFLSARRVRERIE